jgi:hypothetical protein
VRRGNLLARFPTWPGEWPLPVRVMDVDVYIEDGVARTTIDQTFFNHTDYELEGVYSFPLPADAAIARLAMYVDGKLMEAGITERQEGRQIYESIVYRRRDPALLEWMQGNEFRMRVFPLPARTEKRILLSYTQPLTSLYGDYSVRVPIPELDLPAGTLRYRVHLKDRALKLDSCCVDFTVTDKGDERLAEATLNNVKLGTDLALTLYPTSKPPTVTAATMADPAGDYLMVRARQTSPRAPNTPPAAGSSSTTPAPPAAPPSSPPRPASCATSSASSTRPTASPSSPSTPPSATSPPHFSRVDAPRPRRPRRIPRPRGPRPRRRHRARPRRRPRPRPPRRRRRPRGPAHPLPRRRPARHPRRRRPRGPARPPGRPRDLRGRRARRRAGPGPTRRPERGDRRLARAADARRRPALAGARPRGRAQHRAAAAGQGPPARPRRRRDRRAAARLERLAGRRRGPDHPVPWDRCFRTCPSGHLDRGHPRRRAVVAADRAARPAPERRLPAAPVGPRADRRRHPRRRRGQPQADHRPRPRAFPRHPIHLPARARERGDVPAIQGAPP